MPLFYAMLIDADAMPDAADAPPDTMMHQDA